MSAIEKNICQAIDVIVQKAINQASYDKTIQATIISCVDATIGKYKVKYQDSVFYAYSGNSEVSYPDGSNVYILVPGNDMNKDKTILGTTKKLGINYVVVTEGVEAYEPIGNNCITNSRIFELSSYKRNKYVKVLYSKDFQDNQNLIKLDKKSLEQYIKNSKNLICGAKIRTELPPEQRYRGNYGIIFALDFMDNTNNKIITRYYTIDVDKMSGNPYKLVYETRQYGIFEIDGQNFKEINSISIFTYDFPNSKNDNQLVNDIFIKDLEFYGAKKIPQEDLDSYSLTLITPQGTFFDDTSLAREEKKIQAQVKVKGKVVDNNSQNLPFYWFVENAGITSNNKYYNKYGGQGWKCLNKFNIVGEKENKEPIVEYLPASADFVVKKSEVFAKETRYKCVVVYENNILSKEIVIKNLSSPYDITIESDEGTQFYYDIGSPTLTCLVNNEENLNYTYAWAVINNDGNFQPLSETLEENKKYNALVKEYDKLILDIEEERLPLAPNQTKIEELKKKISRYDTITRVEKNKIINLGINTITNFSNYKCSVYSGDNYLGTSALTITNSLETEKGYSLVINNGSQIYKYNENGISPTNKSLENPNKISELKFTIYDNLGKPIDDEIAKHCDIKWIVPSENTLIKISNAYQPSNVDLINKTNIYSNLMSFSYMIEDKYDMTKKRNNIQLVVNYKGTVLMASTDFSFVKEGESGTNGTDFVCRIVPNVIDNNNIPYYPMVVEKTNGTYELNYIPKQKNTWFNAQLWHNGEKIFDSNKTGNTTEGKAVTVIWSILKNKYTSKISDTSNFSILDSANGKFDFKKYEKSRHPSNIIKVTLTYDGVTYYATMPIITAKLSSDNYRISLKDYTGFRYAIYSSDGRKPQYDNSSPFEILVNQKIGNYWEDISTKTSGTYSLAYRWIYKGEIYEEDSWRSSTHLGNYKTTKLNKNQKSIKPLDDFDGQCVNNGLECIVSKSNQEIARIHIPIHLFLNKYGHSALNSWDGNSINIDKDGGFILTPQVGAGIKEKDNSFTGMLMGKVKEANQSKVEIGLFGYAKGIRSIFLDANTGKSTFGSNGKGQIVIDPTEDRAEIYSGNYKEATEDEIGEGLLIDLTTPRIHYGSGNFSVDKDGFLIAKGGGSIAGWNIDDDSLFTEEKEDSNNVRISSIDFKRNVNGRVRETLRMAFGTKFGISSDGTMFAGKALIGSGTNKIILGVSSDNESYSALYTNKKDSFKAKSTGFYIGTDGIALGSFNGENSAFQVDSSGQLIARRGYIGNGASGWEIGTNYLKNGLKTTYNENTTGVYIGTSGIGLGKYFNVSSSGKMYAKRGNIGNWEITNGSIRTEGGTWDNDTGMYFGSSGLRLGTNFSVTSSGTLKCINGEFSGKITASSGKIGGWTITGTGLTNGVMYINSNGSIGGNNWSISAGGYANFSNFHANGGEISMGGTTLRGGSASSGGSTILGSGSTSVKSGGETLSLENFIVKQLTAERIEALIAKISLIKAMSFSVRGAFVAFGDCHFDGESQILVKGNYGLSGKVEFSDNSMLEFRDGFLIGGKNKDGVKFGYIPALNIKP